MSPRCFISSSEAEYSERLEEHSKTWGSTFQQYYVQDIHPDRAKTRRWTLEPLGVICNPYSRVTNNQLEGFDRVIKDFQSWKEAPLDSLILCWHSSNYKYTMEMR